MKADMDWIDELASERGAKDPVFAAANLRADLMLKLLPLRKQRGLTQEQVGQLLGIARAQVAAMETRPHKASLDRIAAYAHVLGARLELVLPKPSKRSRVA
jgi:transcriptional regulator with XRE-family HTH domain